MLKLRLQYFGHLMQRTDSSEKTLIPGKIEGNRRGWQDELDSITNPMDMNLSKFMEIMKDRRAWCVLHSMGSQRVGHDLVTEPQQALF